MNLMENVEETLLILPKSGIRISLVVRTFDSKANKSAIYSYKSQKSGERTLVINTSEYIVFEYKSVDGNLSSRVFISYLHMATLKEGFLYGKNFVENSFIEDAGNYYVKEDHSNGFKIENLVGNKSIMIVPKMIQHENGTEDPGVLMMIGSNECAGFVDFDSFMQLCEFIRNFDLYSSSKVLLNVLINYCNNVEIPDPEPPKPRVQGFLPNRTRNKE